MPNTYKVTINFQHATMGGSESYITSADPPQMPARLQALLDARQKLLYQGHRMISVRVSRLSGPPLVRGIPRSSRLLLPGPNDNVFNPPNPNTGVPGDSIKVPGPAQNWGVGPSSQNAKDQWRSVLHVEFRYNSGAAVIRYMSGIPDAIWQGDDEGFRWTLAPNWKMALDSFFALLKNQGWLVRGRGLDPTPPNVPVGGLASQGPAPSMMGIVVTNAQAGSLPTTGLIHLRGFRNKPHQPISVNGKYYVDSFSDTVKPGYRVLYLRGTESFDPNDVKILGTAQQVLYGTFGIESANAKRVGIHKRGKPSGSPAGRRKTRLKLDP